MGALMGYTPVFDSIYTGTLYGKWPAAAVWASLLPLLDKNGCIDMSLQAISGMTGWPMDLLKQGIEQLMEPDPDSRTPGEDGRRLVPIDPNRPWGWRAVNHSKYREKARKQNYDAERTASGKDAERKRKERSERPAMSRDVPLSNTNTDTDTNTEKKEYARERASDRFDEFWALYPRRVGKAAAKRAWSRKGLNAKADEILEHLRARVRSDAQWLAEGGRFIPHPQTWLNRDGW